jgi:hypothetical protein
MREPTVGAAEVANRAYTSSSMEEASATRQSHHREVQETARQSHGPSLPRSLVREERGGGGLTPVMADRLGAALKAEVASLAKDIRGGGGKGREGGRRLQIAKGRLLTGRRHLS